MMWTAHVSWKLSTGIDQMELTPCLFPTVYLANIKMRRPPPITCATVCALMGPVI